MYIAIEGPKGSGKSTVIQTLSKQITAAGLDCHLLCPTRPMPVHHPLEQRATRGELLADAEQEALYTARSNYHASLIPPDCPLILGDRSIFTSLATRWPHEQKNSWPDYITRVQTQEHLIPWPDHVIYLDIPVDVLLTRLAQRTERTYGKWDETAHRLILAGRAYRQLRDLSPQFAPRTQWWMVNGDQPAPLVAEQLWQLIRHLLERRALPTSHPISQSCEYQKMSALASCCTSYQGTRAAP